MWVRAPAWRRRSAAFARRARPCPCRACSPGSPGPVPRLLAWPTRARAGEGLVRGSDRAREGRGERSSAFGGLCRIFSGPGEVGGGEPAQASPFGVVL